MEGSRAAGRMPTATEWFETWCRAARWQRAVDEALAPWKLAHTRYMLLDIADRIERDTDDAFKQRALVDATQLGEATVASAVRVLEAQGLLSRGPDGIDGRMWRIHVTAAGRRLLARTRPIVEEVASAFGVSAG